MDQQVTFLRHLCRTSENGGRVIPLHGTHVCELYDVAEWTPTMQESLEHHYPYARATIQACTHSLSGFLVRVHFLEHETAVIVTTSALIAVMAAVTVYCMDLM